MSDDETREQKAGRAKEAIMGLLEGLAEARARADDLRALLAARARRAASQGRPIDDDLYLCHWHPWEEKERVDWVTEGIERWVDGEGIEQVVDGDDG